MININEVSETNEMIEKENLDVRTITMVFHFSTASIRILRKLRKTFMTRSTTKQKILLRQVKRSKRNSVFPS